MFGRIQHEDLVGLLKIAGLAFFFLVFIGVVVRVLLMRKEKVDHMANLPLEDEAKAKD